MRFLRWADGYYWDAHPTQWDSSHPDSHRKGGGKARTGNIQHVIAVVMFENLAAQKEKPYDENRL